MLLAGAKPPVVLFVAPEGKSKSLITSPNVAGVWPLHGPGDSQLGISTLLLLKIIIAKSEQFIKPRLYWGLFCATAIVPVMIFDNWVAVIDVVTLTSYVWFSSFPKTPGVDKKSLGSSVNGFGNA